MGLGVAFAWTGNVVEAHRAFAETVRYDPANVEAHYNLGLTYAAMGRNTEALRHFDAAVKLKPDFTEARTARAELLR
jgi:tetratricopeptide (TPR) repeat protein